MFKKFTNGCVRIVNRWLPDPFLFAIILTIVVFIAAMIGTQQGPVALVNAWGNSKGFWGLLSFSMQMALVLVLGSAMASAKICKRALGAIASLAKDKKSAILITTFVSTICCWLNWGFGLIAGALLAKEVARRVRDVDYPLLIASAYSGFVIWHAGLSGSIPLQMGAETGTEILGVVYRAPTSTTIFHPMNLLMVAVILLVMPLVNYAMHPDTAHTITVDPSLLVEDEERTYAIDTPAERIEHNKVLWFITLVLGFAYIVYHFATKGFNLDLNIVNMIFMFLGILLHGDLRRYVDAIADAAGGAAGILLRRRYPASVPLLCRHHGPDGGRKPAWRIPGRYYRRLLHQHLQQRDLPGADLPVGRHHQLLRTLRRRPVGGAGPHRYAAATEMGVEYGRAAMAIAWGDQWTNMIQPFWALPALGIAGLKARNIMGYLVIVLIFTGVVACLGFLGWGLFFHG